MLFGEQIKKAREGKNLSQEELAAQLEVSRQAVSKWENGSAFPNGVNREMLSQILGIAFEEDQTNLPARTVNLQGIAGWVTAGILIVVLICTTMMRTSENCPAITKVMFFDDQMNEIKDEALWYNAANMDGIMIQWEGGCPDTIKMFAAPGGTDTIEETALLLTKEVCDESGTILIDADSLKEDFMNHVYFELDFSGTIVVSDQYEIFCDRHNLESQVES